MDKQPKTSYLRHALGRAPDGSKRVATPRERVEELRGRVVAAEREIELIQRDCNHTTDDGQSAYQPMEESACAVQCQTCLKVI